MQSYPHHYSVRAVGGPTGSVALSAQGLPTLQTAPPVQFDGTGDEWSPETLLVGAAADCLLLTFRAMARASNLTWSRLDCDATGTLDRAEGGTRFTELDLRVRLVVPPGTDTGKASRLLEKAEKACLITQSLVLKPTMTCEVQSMDGGDTSLP